MRGKFGGSGWQCDRMEYMSNEYVTVRNLDTRQVGQVRRRLVDHEFFGARLEEVPDGSKSFVPLDELVNGAPDDSEEPETVEDLVNLEHEDYEEMEDEA